jgi:predicted dehydrogenase
MPGWMWIGWAYTRPRSFKPKNRKRTITLKPITVLLFGAGARGIEYGKYALGHPDEIRFIAVAEPDPVRRQQFAEAHGISPDHCFDTWEATLFRPKFADVVLNATQDQMHYASSIAAMEAGYDLILEKPICNTLEETMSLVDTAERLKRKILVCHVLRYTRFFRKIKEIVDSGELGEIITVSHRENVVSWHMAHSYVRGNWRREDQSSPMILAKCCHDLDLLYWIFGSKVKKLSSVGSLKHYRLENAPADVPERCLDGCPIAETCPFFAPALYLDVNYFKYMISQSDNPWHSLVGHMALKTPEFARLVGKIVPPVRQLTEYAGWPLSVISTAPESKEALTEAMRTGPYGRCVYHCDNDVVDHQIVLMEMENGTSVSLTMHGHSHEEGRTLRIDGSQATLLAKMGIKTFIEVYDHREPSKIQRFTYCDVEEYGHGGGDIGIMRDFVKAMHGEMQPLTGIRDSIESHLMAFAAEQARVEGVVIDMDAYREQSGR